MEQRLKPQIKWTEDKINLLKKEYPLGDKNELSKKLGIKRSTLKYAAKRFKVKSLISLNNFAYAKLLRDLNESWYWQGFIMGDGHIRKTGILTITVSEKDKIHLEKLQSFVDGKITTQQKRTGYTTGNYSTFISHDTDSANKFLNRYKLLGPKTYSPPDLNCLDSKDKFVSFFIGLFDADGCFDIRKNGTISTLKIEIHSNWKNTLEYISDNLKKFLGIESKVKYTSRGYIKLLIHKSEYIKLLKQNAILLKIPFLERKWDKVDINYTPKKFIIKQSISTIETMLTNGDSWAKIANVLGVTTESLRRRYKEIIKQSK